MKKTFKSLAIATIAASAVLLSGCSSSSTDVTTTEGIQDGPNVLRVLAGSEVKDMQPILDELEKETGVQVAFEYAGTLEGTQQVANGDTDGVYDATWFPSNRYLSLLDGGTAAVKKEEKIMNSPVVLGLKPEVASNLGWDANTPTWQDIVDAVNAGKLTYGMTSPVSSNSGFSTLIEAGTALSGTGDVLTTENIASVTPALESFFKGQKLTSGSSGWLADKFVEDPSVADGIFNYESVLKGLSIDGKPLTLIAPSDGVITADYPLTLLKSASSEKEELYNKAVSYLNEDATQEKIAELTNRRTATSTQSADAPVIFELPFPNKLETVQALISAYLTDIKNPSDVFFTIDTSGSMAGGRMDELKNALSLMVDTSSQNSFLVFRNRETVTYTEFADGVKAQNSYAIEENNSDEQLAEIQAYIDSLNSVGGTAIYDALEESYKKALEQKKADPDHFVSIALFSDGENTAGHNYQQFQEWYADKLSKNPELAQIPTYVILFGEGDPEELSSLSDLTGGKLFSAQGSSLTEIFKEIRGYQ